MIRPPPKSPLFPNPPLFRSNLHGKLTSASPDSGLRLVSFNPDFPNARRTPLLSSVVSSAARRTAERKSAVPAIIFLSVSLGRSEEHTSELQSRLHLVCRLLL